MYFYSIYTDRFFEDCKSFLGEYVTLPQHSFAFVNGICSDLVFDECFACSTVEEILPVLFVNCEPALLCSDDISWLNLAQQVGYGLGYEIRQFRT